MNAVVYTLCACDPAYCQMADMLIYSLRTYGLFHGPVILFCDNPEHKHPDGTVIQCKVSGSPIRRQAFKAKIELSSTLLIPQGCDRVVFMDSDSLVIAPFADLLGFGPVSAFEEQQFGEADSTFLPDGYSVGKGLAYNGGMIVADASKWAEFVHAWQEESSYDNGEHFSDQRPLNMVAKAHPDWFSPLPLDWLYFFDTRRTRISEHTKVLHFKGWNRFLTMQAVFDLLKRFEFSTSTGHRALL